jgi:hypothetical protein
MTTGRIGIRSSLMPTRINVARGLVLLGFLLGLNSIYFVIKMVGDPYFLLVPSSHYPPTHSWYIAFRELIGVSATMAAIALAFWAPERYRTRVAWWMCAVLMFGYYGALWVGRPFMASLAAPNVYAELTHIFMTVPAVAGLMVAWPEFSR